MGQDLETCGFASAIFTKQREALLLLNVKTGLDQGISVVSIASLTLLAAVWLVDFRQIFDFDQVALTFFHYVLLPGFGLILFLRTADHT